MKGKSAVLTFIDKERAKGAKDKEIRHKLLDAGWHMDIVSRAMKDHKPKTPHAPRKPLTKKQLTELEISIMAGSLLILAVLLALYI